MAALAALVLAGMSWRVGRCHKTAKVRVQAARSAEEISTARTNTDDGTSTIVASSSPPAWASMLASGESRFESGTLHQMMGFKPQICGLAKPCMQSLQAHCHGLLLAVCVCVAVKFLILDWLPVKPKLKR